MPPVIIAVVSIGSAVIGAVGGAAFLAGLSLSAFVGVTLVAGTAIIAGGAMLATKLMSIDMPGVPDTDKSRQVTSKSTVEPMKIIYGQALVSGPLAFLGLSGDDNEDLHHVIALAGHEVEAITDVWLDDEVIINPNGIVTSGTFGPVTVTVDVPIFNGIEFPNIPQVQVYKYLGTADQTYDPILVSRFADYSTNNKGQGIAYIHTIFTLLEATVSQELWGKYSPNNIRALVKGRKVYDPRLDVAAGNAAGANPANPSYIAYSDNPALCVADYLTNKQFGMGVATNKVDWLEVIIAADACDVSVPVPGGTEKRFTANGVLFGTDPHMTSINKLLSSMNGSLVYSGGEYIISAGVYQAPTHVLTEDDLAGSVTVKTSVERADRFNTVKSIIIDPAQNNKSVEVPRVQLTAAFNRDNQETLEREINLPFTNSSYMAQRIANKLIQMSDQQKLLTFPANLSAMAITVGDRVEVNIEELGFSSKVFRCMGWSFTESGISLTLAEDDPGSYADPDAIEYSTISAAGIITNGFPGVPDPQSLIAVAGVNSIDLNWRNPSNTSRFSSVIVYASSTDQWSDAVEIGRGIITSFKHDASTEADSITSGDQRWYWIRAIGIGSSANVFSDRNPDNDQSNVTATALTNIADSVEWQDVSNLNGGRPFDNATVGATAGSNLTASTGALLGDDDVLNSVVIEDITEIQLAGTGEILELIGGARADLQQLGDVAAYAFNNGQYLLGITNDLDASFGNLQQTVVDITAGTTDVFVSDEPPVAGVGGVPDPIDIYSRWYDSNDNNKPYYWNGTTWVDLSDPRIASNQSEITAVSANLDGTITTVNGHTTQISATTSAVSVLDATVVLIDEDLVALTGSYDAFVLAYDAEDADGRIAVNAGAIDTLELKVEDIDGLIAVSATDITELKVSRQNYTKLEGTDGEPLTLVNDGPEIELQDTSAVGGATGTAVSILDTRIVETERGISVTSQDIVSLTSALNDTNLNLAGEANAISNLSTIVEIQGDVITATSSDIVLLTARVGNNEGEINQLNTVTAGSTSLLVKSFLELTGTVGDAQGDITQLNTVDLSSTSALVLAHLKVSSTVGENTAVISQQLESINGIEANYSVKVDINDRITGFGFNSTAANAEPDSLFYIIADRFAVVNPESTEDAPIVPFAITYDVETSTSKVIMTGNVIIDGDLITTGTVNADRIDVAGIITAGSIVIGSDIENFIVGSDVNANVTSISGGAITTGTVKAANINIDGITLSRSGDSLVINAEGVGTAQLAGNAVTIDKIADSIQSSDYVTGVSGWKITKAGASEFSNVTVRGSVDAGSINIDGVTLDTDPITGNLIVKGGGIGTGQLATGAVTADQLAPVAVTADKVDPNAIIFSQGDVVVIYNWDGTNHSPSADYIDVPVIFTNVIGESIAGVTTLRITWVSSTELTGAEFGTNDDTVVTVDAGGGTSDGYVRMKVVHTASGISTYVTGTILASGGSGGK